MSFDELAQNLADTLSGVFGGVFTLERLNEYRGDLTAIIRRGVETVDESGQILVIELTARFSSSGLPFKLKRGDTLSSSTKRYTIGRLISDNGFFVEYELTQ